MCVRGISRDVTESVIQQCGIRMTDSCTRETVIEGISIGKE